MARHAGRGAYASFGASRRRDAQAPGAAQAGRPHERGARRGSWDNLPQRGAQTPAHPRQMDKGRNAMTLVDELSEAGVEVLVDQMCDAFEEAWRGESSPAIEAYLERVAESHRAALFTELLLSDCECRRRRGEQPRADDY